jgi:hypothetical protein
VQAEPPDFEEAVTEASFVPGLDRQHVHDRETNAARSENPRGEIEDDESFPSGGHFPSCSQTGNSDHVTAT